MLQIKEDATDEEIAKAYKKAALKYHPDKNREVDTTQIFIALQEAYKHSVIPIKGSGMMTIKIKF